MIYTKDELLNLAYETQALSIWDREKGPVFWYAANVPGPFYFNTEVMIGAPLAERLLREITAIVSGTVDAQTRATQLTSLILEAYKAAPSWQNLIATMIDKAHQEFGPNGFSVISGGERRDWLFSIPFAQALGLPHLFLFKNRTVYCAQHLQPKQSTLHVSDLINNAASFFDYWATILEDNKLVCVGNMCVSIRGSAGAQRLKAAGQKTHSLLTIDSGFFRQLHAAELVDQATYEEISVFFSSVEEWASTYLMENPKLFNVETCDSKSLERLRNFLSSDPWSLRKRHADIFSKLQNEMTQRDSKAA